MTFDQELAVKGKMRTQVAEHIQRPDGTFAVAMRQKIVKIPKNGPVAVKVAKPKITRKRAPKGQPTKQSRANEIVANIMKGQAVTKDLKKQAIGDIMVMLDMTKAGATTYMHNALKAL